MTNIVQPTASANSPRRFCVAPTAPGKRVRKPNLFVVGAMKAGTTLIWRLLASHPDVFMSSPKEPSHFVDGEDLRRLQPHLWRQGYWRSRDRYLSLFAEAGDRPVIGEASVYYTHLPDANGVARRIFDFNPEARILYLMRDPVRRTISHYWHNVQHNWEHRPPAEAILEDGAGYRHVSHYAVQLAPYLRSFPAHRVKTLTFEALLEAPHDTVTELLRWLGLSPLGEPIDLTPENETPAIVRQKPQALRRLKALADQSPFLPHLVDAMPSRLRTFLSQALARPQAVADIDMEPIAKALAPLQQKETAALSALLGRRFPEWRLLYSY